MSAIRFKQAGEAGEAGLAHELMARHSDYAYTSLKQLAAGLS
jgi:hypothetical protein